MHIAPHLPHHPITACCRDSYAQSGRKDYNLPRRKMVTNHDLANRLSKFQMVVKSSREAYVLLKNCIQWFPRSLIRIFLLVYYIVLSVIHVAQTPYAPPRAMKKFRKKVKFLLKLEYRGFRGP